MRRYERMTVGLAGLLVLGTTGAWEKPVSLGPFTPFTLQQLTDAPVLVAQATRRGIEYDAVLGTCQFVEPNDPIGSAINSIPTRAPVAQYLGIGPNTPLSDVQVRILSRPRHGTIELNPDTGSMSAYHYFPNREYRGKDQMSFEVEANGRRFKVIFTVFVVDNVDRVAPETLRRCRIPGIVYRISQTLD